MVDALTAIYEEFGYYQEELLCLDYEGKAGAEKISRIMSHFRENVKDSFADKKLSKIEDYEKSMIFDFQSNQNQPIHLPKSNVLGLFFTNGDIVYLRPSGTEPKIKFYLMVNEKEGSLSEKQELAQEKIDQYILNIKKIAEDC